MALIEILYLAMIWGIPILIIWNTYRKMSEEERRKLVSELKSSESVLGIIPAGIGLLVFLTGSVLALGLRGLQHVGIGLIFFGWFFIWTTNLLKKEESTAKSMAMILLGVAGVIMYAILF